MHGWHERPDEWLVEWHVRTPPQGSSPFSNQCVRRLCMNCTRSLVCRQGAWTGPYRVKARSFLRRCRQLSPARVANEWPSAYGSCHVSVTHSYHLLRQETHLIRFSFVCFPDCACEKLPHEIIAPASGKDTSTHPAKKNFFQTVPTEQAAGSLIAS